MDEFELIRRYFQRPEYAPPVVTGIGDDGAVLQPAAGRQLVTVIDTLVAGTHFPVDMDATDIGYRAVAVNLSDVAAMGAQPRWMTLALTLVEANPEWLEPFASGIHEAASEWGVQLVGGDTTRGDQLVVTVQMTGDVLPGNAVHRSGAQIGDTIYVTGTVGDAAAGLRQLAAGPADGYLARRYARPDARVHDGSVLAGIAHAAIDLSDGLVADISKLLEASDVGAVVDIDRLPLSPQLLEAEGREQALRFALGGGDDYELCFTMAETDLPESKFHTRVTAIGRVTGGSSLECRDGGVVVPVDDSGYRHF